MRLPSFTALSLSLAILLCCAAISESAQWWKGNLHTHSYWSDGDDFPEMITDWYKQNGYHFLAISDHNILAQGERWRFVDDLPRGAEALPKYIERFGEEWVETREVDGRTEVRLQPLNQYAPLFNEPGAFLLIQGLEITDNFTIRRPVHSLPVHLNATNLIEYIMPRGGDSVRETMQNNIDAVLEQRERTGQPMFPHINHPNFGWAITVEDIMALKGEKFFEVYNGHPAVRNYGDDLRPSMERMWDIILTKRLAEMGKPVMWGLATDDAHNYHEERVGLSNTGRGWVMVRAEFLTPEHLIRALEAGDFYASSGVTMASIETNQREMRLRIQAEEGVTYTTHFIGTRIGYDPSSEPQEDPNAPHIAASNRYSDDIGVVLAEVEGTQPLYVFEGDEIYVRATITSSKLHPNPYAEGDYEQAWIQPTVLNAIESNQ